MRSGRAAVERGQHMPLEILEQARCAFARPRQVDIDRLEQAAAARTAGGINIAAATLSPARVVKNKHFPVP